MAKGELVFCPDCLEPHIKHEHPNDEDQACIEDRRRNFRFTCLQSFASKSKHLFL